MNGYVEFAWKNARRVVVSVIGGTIILLGVIGILLPVLPGFIFFPLGLAVLATEFVWAKRWLGQVKKKSRQFMNSVTGSVPSREAGLGQSPCPPQTVDSDRPAS